MSVTLTFPLPPNLANGRMHWRVKLNRKKAYLETLGMLLAAKQIPAAGAKIERALIAATLYVHQPMDDDNAMARLKWILDWLVWNDYLADDSRKNVEWSGMPKQVVDRKRPRVEILLTEIPSNDPD